MFFKLVSRNSRRSRKENGLFFSSLLVSIVAFYIILSLSQQDVMFFLKRMESDAVDKLMKMIPMFYGAALFILFFLIYYAGSYQLKRRRHEFGVYLMMGMRQSKLFAMLFLEDLRGSLFALLTGLPLAILLSELISLITARLVGIGIIGHHFSFSPVAAGWTVAGFLLIKLAAFFILSGRIAGEEIGDLLSDTPEGLKKQLPAPAYMLSLVLGSVLLCMAYQKGISGVAWRDMGQMGLTLLFGIAGTMLLFFGLRVVIGYFAGYGGRRNRLHVFQFRQLEENVIRCSNAMAVCSLLMLAAACCFGAGVAIAWHSGESEPHILDYTFEESELDAGGIRRLLAEYGLEARFSELFDMEIGRVRRAEERNESFQMDSVMSALRALPESPDREVLLNNLGYAYDPRLISLSGYNRLLSAAGKKELELSADEAAVYIDPDFITDKRKALLNAILETGPEGYLAGNPVCLTGEVQTTRLVTDRAITLSFALILPDEAFALYTEGNWDVYLNGVLKRDDTKEISLMNAISDMNEELDKTGVVYESYLKSMGRQLFYMVAASYITIYLAIIFLIVANTMLGVQFLTGQQKSGRRYRTLIRLGTTYELLCQSAGKQILWYFGIPIAVAAVSSLFGVRALFAGLLTSQVQENMTELMLSSAAMIFAFFIVECIYIAAVRRSSSRYLLTLLEPAREE